MARPAPEPVGALLTIPQVAERLGVTRQTVYSYIRGGLIDRVDIGRGKPKTRISEAALGRFIERHTIPGRKAA
jgi:excisionase family DNA binding protein